MAIILACVALLLNVPTATAQEDTQRRALSDQIETLLFEERYLELAELGERLRDSIEKFPDGTPKLLHYYDKLSASIDHEGLTARQAVAQQLPLLKAWHRKEPSLTSTLALAMAHVNMSWAARGEGVAGTITSQDSNVMEASGSLAEERLDEATEIARKQNIKSLGLGYIRLNAGMLQGYSPDEMRGYLHDCLAIDPWCDDAIRWVANYLLPRWYGDQDSLLNLANDLSRKYQDQTGDFCYAVIAEFAVDLEEIDSFVAEGDEGFVWSRVRDGFDRWFSKIGDYPRLEESYALCAHIARDRETARRALDIMNGSWTEFDTNHQQTFERTVRWAYDNGQTGEALKVIELGYLPALGVAFADAGRAVLPVTISHELTTFRVPSGEQIESKPIFPNTILGAIGTPDGKACYLVFWSSDGRKRIFRADLIKWTSQPVGVIEADPRCLSTSQDGRMLALGDFRGNVHLWREGEPGEPYLPYTWVNVHPTVVTGIALSPDGSRLASGHDRTVKIWNTKNRKLIRTLALDTDHLEALAWSPDGSILASSGRSKLIQLWNPDEGIVVGELSNDRSIFRTLAFSPKGQRLVAGTYSHGFPILPGEVVVFDVASRDVIKTYAGHRMNVRKVVVSPDGTKIVSASKDGTLRIWPMPTQAK